jgi:hypothetical protein
LVDLQALQPNAVAWLHGPSTNKFHFGSAAYENGEISAEGCPSMQCDLGRLGGALGH